MWSENQIAKWRIKYTKNDSKYKFDLLSNLTVNFPESMNQKGKIKDYIFPIIEMEHTDYSRYVSFYKKWREILF